MEDRVHQLEKDTIKIATLIESSAKIQSEILAKLDKQDGKIERLNYEHALVKGGAILLGGGISLAGIVVAAFKVIH